MPKVDAKPELRFLCNRQRIHTNGGWQGFLDALMLEEFGDAGCDEVLMLETWPVIGCIKSRGVSFKGDFITVLYNVYNIFWGLEFFLPKIDFLVDTSSCEGLFAWLTWLRLPIPLRVAWVRICEKISKNWGKTRKRDDGAKIRKIKQKPWSRENPQLMPL